MDDGCQAGGQTGTALFTSKIAKYFDQMAYIIDLPDYMVVNEIHMSATGEVTLD